MDDTIAAIATVVGEASIGVVRLSGPSAVPIADRLFRGARRQRLGDVPSHTVHYGWVMDPTTGQEVDEVLATVMRAPRSYTREDIVEFSGHGGVVGVRRILALALAAGARLADPGEFTQRAFLNGRIDLAQAEAVLQLIRATHEAAQAAGLQQLRGGLSSRLHAVRQRLLTIQAHMEVSVDFPDEGHPAWPPERLQAEVEHAARTLDTLLTTSARGRLALEGCVTVICGRPNVGKSSVLNAMLRRDRAIVTPIPGTTRDTIEERLLLDGIPVRLIDTAGITDSADPIEVAGVQRSREALASADVALCVLDGSEPLHPKDLAVLDLLRDREVIVALNKMDLPRRLPAEAVRAAMPRAPIVPISAVLAHGIEALESSLVEAVQRARPADPGTPWVTMLRHATALRDAGGALRRVQEALVRQVSPECAVVDLREAVDQLGLVTGETVNDELLATIFSQFCIGK